MAVGTECKSESSLSINKNIFSVQTLICIDSVQYSRTLSEILILPSQQRRLLLLIPKGKFTICINKACSIYGTFLYLR